MDILSEKMVALIFNVFGLLGLSQAYIFSGSHESNPCITDNEELSCVCKNREDISMSGSMNFHISVIQVSGCGVVTVTFGAFSHLQLDKIFFNDISTLVIRSYAFVGAQTVYTLQIEDIRTFNVETRGFFGLSNVSDIIIRNVSSISLDEGACSGISTVENFLIENSNFGEIKYNVFLLTNITQFSVVDSKIDVMGNTSFMIHNSKNVLFQGSSIQEAKNLSFSMAYIDSVTFFDCNFGLLDTDAIHIAYSGSFKFDSCTVSELNMHAITVMDLIESVTFTHNNIVFGYDYPLYIGSENWGNESSVEEKLSIFTCCNYFLCNCDIYWMWISEEPFYDIKTSLCIGTDTKLSDMTPILDSHGNCMTLENKIGKTNLEVTTNRDLTTNSEITKHLKDGNGLDGENNIKGSSQAQAAATLLKMQFTWMMILCGLSVFIRSL